MESTQLSVIYTPLVDAFLQNRYLPYPKLTRNSTMTERFDQFSLEEVSSSSQIGASKISRRHSEESGVLRSAQDFSDFVDWEGLEKRYGSPSIATHSNSDASQGTQYNSGLNEQAIPPAVPGQGIIFQPEESRLATSSPQDSRPRESSRSHDSRLPVSDISTASYSPTVLISADPENNESILVFVGNCPNDTHDIDRLVGQLTARWKETVSRTTQYRTRMLKAMATQSNNSDIAQCAIRYSHISNCLEETHVIRQASPSIRQYLNGEHREWKAFDQARHNIHRSYRGNLREKYSNLPSAAGG